MVSWGSRVPVVASRPPHTNSLTRSGKEAESELLFQAVQMWLGVVLTRVTSCFQDSAHLSQRQNLVCLFSGWQGASEG